MFMITRVISCSMHMIEFDLVTNPEQCRTHSVCPSLVRIKSHRPTKFATSFRADFDLVTNTDQSLV